MAEENASTGSLGVNAEEAAAQQARQREADKAARAAKASAPLVSTDDPDDDGLIEVKFVNPWRIAEFRTPALPGVVVTQAGIRLPPEQAQIAYDELKRSGFTPVSSVPLEDVTNSEDVQA